jgi:hypothetical protein
VGVSESGDVGLELLDAAMHAAPDVPVGEQREPTFDLMGPGGADRREVHPITWVVGEPLDRQCLVGSAIIEHQTDIEIDRHRVLNLRQEVAEFGRAVTRMVAADDPADGNLQGGE